VPLSFPQRAAARTAAAITAVVALMLGGCGGAAPQIAGGASVLPGGPAAPRPAEPVAASRDPRPLLPVAPRAAMALVEDDAALDAGHSEDDVRYNPNRPLTTSERLAGRCRQHLPALDRGAERAGADTLLIAAIAWVESGFSPSVESPAGARGIMQLQPVASRAFGCRDPFDVGCAAEAAGGLLRALLRRYRGDLVYALCAYHAGPLRPTRAWRKGDLPANLHYATRVLEARARLERFGCDGRPVKTGPGGERVSMNP